MWWDGDIISPSAITNLGSGLYNVSLNPIFVAPGEDPILFNMTITTTRHGDKYYETYIAVEDEVEAEIYLLNVDIINQF